MPEISIIVPCYKTEKTLAKCVHSLTSQTFRDIEIILVDDCSPDSTGDLCEKLKEEDFRIKTVHLKTNSGPSAARNAGIDVAESTWITFADSDDWVEPETYSTAIEYAKKYDAELVIWSYYSEYGENLKEKHIYDSDIIFSGTDSDKLFKDILGPGGDRLKHPELIHSLSPVWNKLFKLDIVNRHNIRFFDLNKIGPEDLFFSAQYAKHCTDKNSVYIDKCLYHYVKSDGNSISTSYNPNYITTLDYSSDGLTKLINDLDKNEEYQTVIRNRRAFSLINIGLNEINNPEGFAKIFRKLNHVICNEKYHNAFRQLDISELPLKWKIFFICASMKLTLPVILMLKIMSLIITKHD